MNIFARRSQDGASTPRVQQETSAASTGSSAAIDQSARTHPESGGTVLVRQASRSGYQMTDNMVNGTNPIDATTYSEPSNSPAHEDINLHGTQVPTSEIGEGRLVDGISEDEQSSDEDSASRMQGVEISRDFALPQTPAPTNATPPTTSAGSNPAIALPPSQTPSSLGNTGFPPPNPRSTAADTQTDQPPTTQPVRAQRLRRRFTNWLRRHSSHRHGPWAPSIRRNWNAVSNAIREVERHGLGRSRRPNIEEELSIDEE